ncbi:MAG: ribonuclease HII [Bacteroidota bacterium]
MLKSYHVEGKIEAGCDEAGRGCLAGPVVAAAVILPADYQHTTLDDSKKLKPEVRAQLVDDIKTNALSWAIGICDHEEIDKYNILKASFIAMHKAIDSLKTRPELLLIDGNRFIPYQNIDHECIIKGDSKYLSIAAASILAKTHRDHLMSSLARQYPEYGWEHNFGYPTKKHRAAIAEYGSTPYHRQSFTLLPPQLDLFQE